MPHLLSFTGHGTDHTTQEMEQDNLLRERSPRRPSLLKNFGSLFKRHHEHPQEDGRALAVEHTLPQSTDPPFITRRHSLEDHRRVTPRRPIPSLPRPQTIRRQESERRERLLEVEPTLVERRAFSADRRRRGLSASAVQRPHAHLPPPFLPSWSASQIESTTAHSPPPQNGAPNDHSSNGPPKPNLPPLQIPERPEFGFEGGAEHNDDGVNDNQSVDEHAIYYEYEQSWILNLSMTFRDRSNREKFFITYAQKPSKWRRLTISVDYRNAPPNSLEAELSSLRSYRDKSFEIFKQIRESLPEIQYFDTVTNLKLETNPEDGQLHVHVREDANEIIQYPPLSSFRHVRKSLFRESELEFIEHISGFVYRVEASGRVEAGDRVMIKKEIPGPDTVDEFLYEVNALDALCGDSNVIQLRGLVTDDEGAVVKGLLIAYAPCGTLVDILCDCRGTPQLLWDRREKWAKQIVQGLSSIHEAGFVQGDFTLSNIVIDRDDNVRIIDINRRGCPVGWEPPELSRLIESGQRVGMHIGVKTDLFQLGMVLWALAEVDDEPEAHRRPLPPVNRNTPLHIQRIIQICLEDRPQDRKSAKTLLDLFPPTAGRPPSRRSTHSVEFYEPPRERLDDSISTHCSEKVYCDPEVAVTIDEARRGRIGHHKNPTKLSEGVTYVESSGSWVIEEPRGRSPVSSGRRRSSPHDRTLSSATSLSAEMIDRPHDGEHGGERPTKERTTDSCPYPRTILDEDLPQTTETWHSHDGDRQEHQPQPHPEAALLWPEEQQQGLTTTTFTHTDSGFDEHMTEMLNVKNDRPSQHGLAVDMRNEGGRLHDRTERL